MVDETRDFSVLTDWIKNFKTQQGRDPLFVDFPAAIGTATWQCLDLCLSVLNVSPATRDYLQARIGSVARLTSKNL